MWVRAGWRVLIVTGVVQAACVRPSATVCSDGRICPSGDVCDDLHGRCVHPEQLTICVGVRWDGTNWASETVSGASWKGVWGTSPDNVFIVGNSGGQIRWAGDL